VDQLKAIQIAMNSDLSDHTDNIKIQNKHI